MEILPFLLITSGATIRRREKNLINETKNSLSLL
jgi:hypothetical protein